MMLNSIIHKKSLLPKITKVFLAAILFILSTQSLLAIEYGGIGGKPANPREDNPRTESIFIHTLEEGESKQDGVLVINNSETTKTLLVYAADSTPSTDGAFACKQLVEPKTNVGSWITLEKSEVTLEPGTSDLVNFTINIPTKVGVGEHNGCILIQEKAPEQEEKTGLSLSFRTGLRVAITVPGEIVRKLEIEDLTVTKLDNGLLLLQPAIRNSGNVSIDTNTKVVTESILGRNHSVHEGQFPILREDVLELNFEVEQPLWGGWYRATMQAEYDNNPEAVIGLTEEQSLVTLEGPSIIFFTFPQPLAFFIESISLILLIGAGIFSWYLIRKEKEFRTNLTVYKTKRNESIDSIAKRHNITWKALAKANQLKPPYEITQGQIINIPLSNYSFREFFTEEFIARKRYAIRKCKAKIQKISSRLPSLLLFFTLVGYFTLAQTTPLYADTTDLVITACDVNDVVDAPCLSALSTDGSTSAAFTKGAHADAPFQILGNDAINSATLYYDSWGTLSGTWGIYITDARDGTTICSVDPAPEDASETTNSTSCTMTSAQASSGVWLYIINNDGAGPEDINLDYVRLNVDYTPASAVLSVDIVDGVGTPVVSPSISMNSVALDFIYQTTSGTFGAASEQIRIDNPTVSPQWSLTFAANGGTTSFWDGVSTDYDFNDPTAQAQDGADTDSLGGQMTVDPSIASITPQGGCASTDIALGSSASFSEGATDSITLATAGATAETSCFWDITGISVSQTIPAEQLVDSYAIDMTLTITAI